MNVVERRVAVSAREGDLRQLLVYQRITRFAVEQEVGLWRRWCRGRSARERLCEYDARPPVPGVQIQRGLAVSQRVIEAPSEQVRIRDPLLDRRIVRHHVQCMSEQRFRIAPASDS